MDRPEDRLNHGGLLSMTTLTIGRLNCRRSDVSTFNQIKPGLNIDGYVVYNIYGLKH